MATVYRELRPERATMKSSGFPTTSKASGTNLAAFSLAFDPTTINEAFWCFPMIRYGSGNLTLEIYWYATSATTGTVRWGAAISAITADTDTQDILTDAFATELTVDDAHLGTTARRLHKATITISNLDSVANGDVVVLRLRRVANHANDTMTGYANLRMMVLSYSDT